MIAGLGSAGRSGTNAFYLNAADVFLNLVKRGRNPTLPTGPDIRHDPIHGYLTKNRVECETQERIQGLLKRLPAHQCEGAAAAPDQRRRANTGLRQQHPTSRPR
jgi:urocanate hydratase